MRTREEIVKEAADSKLCLVNRAKRIEELSMLLFKIKAGTVPQTMSDSRVETMEKELNHAVAKQKFEGYVFATLRWVLGITDDIDPNNLQLDL